MVDKLQDGRFLNASGGEEYPASKTRMIYSYRFALWNIHAYL